MNQTEFARLLGVSQPLVSKWEIGSYNFTLRKIAEIAVKLDLDISISANDVSADTKKAVQL